MSDAERRLDRDRIDRAVKLIEDEMAAGGMDVVAAGAKALVLLLERRSKLLGLDNTGDAPAQPESTSGVVAAIRQYAADSSRPRLVKP
jgi:hypothetical protein